jgi:hypothetical protein
MMMRYDMCQMKPKLAFLLRILDSSFRADWMDSTGAARLISNLISHEYVKMVKVQLLTSRN